MEKELVTRIAEVRKSKGISQGKLADMVDCRRETIIYLEKGKYNPSLRLAYDIAQVLETPIEQLFSFVDVEDE